MRDYIISRVMLVIPSVFVLTVLVFGMVRLLPGDVVDTIAAQLSGGRGGEIDPETKERIRRDLGLDKPIYIQYFVWIGQIARGDLGKSLLTKIDIVEDIKRRFPVTFELVIFTLVLMVLWGLSVGIFSAIRQDSWMDYVLRSVADHRAVRAIFLDRRVAAAVWLAVVQLVAALGRQRVLRRPLAQHPAVLLPRRNPGRFAGARRWPA